MISIFFAPTVELYVYENFCVSIESFHLSGSVFENGKNCLLLLVPKGRISVRYHSRRSMKINACNLLLAHMVYL
jgi:hypothetical protein